MQPGLFLSFVAIVGGIFIAGRFWPDAATTIVMAFAYTSFGVAWLIGGVDVAGMPFFLAGFVALVLGIAPWTTWQARRPWRVPLAWWATTVAVTWPFFAWRDLNGSLASGAAGPIVTAAAQQMCCALWIDHWLAERSKAEDVGKHLRLTVGRPLLASAVLTAVAAIYQQWVDITWLSLEPWPRLDRAVGLMGDANPMGVATALWAPVAWASFSVSAISSLAGFGIALLLWGAAWASGARSSLILMLAGAVALSLAASASLGRIRRLAAVVIVAIVVIVVATAARVSPNLPPTSPLARLGRTVMSASVPDAAYELLWRRDGYGLAAVAAIREHPWFGVGIGRFFAVSTRYHQRVAGGAIPPDNAQNLWRQTLVEQGLLGLLPILWLTGLTAATLMTWPVSSRDVILRTMLLGFGAILMVGYPLQDSGIAVTFATLLSAVIAGSKSRVKR